MKPKISTKIWKRESLIDWRKSYIDLWFIIGMLAMTNLVYFIMINYNMLMTMLNTIFLATTILAHISYRSYQKEVK